MVSLTFIILVRKRFLQLTWSAFVLFSSCQHFKVSKSTLGATFYPYIVPLTALSCFSPLPNNYRCNFSNGSDRNLANSFNLRLFERYEPMS